MHSCSEHSSNLSCAQRDQYCPRVLVCIMRQRCHGWVELDPGMHIFQGIQEQFQESYSVDGKINVQDTSTCPALVPERNWSWPCFLSSSLCTSLTFLPCSVTALTIPHPCVSAASRFWQQRDGNQQPGVCRREKYLCTPSTSWGGACRQPLLHCSKADSKLLHLLWA